MAVLPVHTMPTEECSMRKYAYLKEPLKQSGRTIYKIMLYETEEGVYLFEYDSPDAVQCASDTFYETMEDLKFKVGPKSFYQTNTEQAYHLYSVARKLHYPARSCLRRGHCLENTFHILWHQE